MPNGGRRVGNIILDSSPDNSGFTERVNAANSDTPHHFRLNGLDILEERSPWVELMLLRCGRLPHRSQPGEAGGRGGKLKCQTAPPLRFKTTYGLVWGSTGGQTSPINRVLPLTLSLFPRARSSPGRGGGRQPPYSHPLHETPPRHCP